MATDARLCVSSRNRRFARQGERPPDAWQAVCFPAGRSDPGSGAKREEIIMKLLRLLSRLVLALTVVLTGCAMDNGGGGGTPSSTMPSDGGGGGGGSGGGGY
jgi:uncharacterized membrane protein YgcG